MFVFCFAAIDFYTSIFLEMGVNKELDTFVFKISWESFGEQKKAQRQIES
jgi:hypothetical protein